MQKGAVYTVTPTGMAQGGDAVARIDGRACFVTGALPGEVVEIIITQVTPTYVRATAQKIITASPDRVEPKAPGAPHMEWQHIAHAAQVSYKAAILHEQLAHLGKIQGVPAVETVAGSNPWHYRNNARLHGYGAYIGYRADGSAHVTEVLDDPLLQPELQEAVAALRVALKEHPPEPRHHWSIVLRLSETTGEIVAAFMELPNRVAIALRAKWVELCPRVVGVQMPWGGFEGPETIKEIHMGMTMELRATTFFQVSLGAAQALCDTVIEALGDTSGHRIIDAYCGSGTFTLPLARQSDRVIGIEEYTPAVENGQKNAWGNQLENVEWYNESVEKGIMHVHHADAVVLDPPRKGCHPAVIQSLLRFKPTKIAYVSCHPGTLARDVGLLTAAGYAVRSVHLVDCFPQTAHIESVVLLTRTGE